ncbi:hypothetical protein JDV02_003808 [Purpureocillium takamizusanense]|uniref:Uncharacterized protein n=1 Tax=Purpureocillium takamizusanense TaxID=2060973 RepID=A0A9Q8QEX0_9HYPO|nr:uncharacterized protein JDV02_003808 [Purpureocillium takamizusanense]UNI17467.1 hypothetical protein JDV02_003808 [Purpureocillium takamizusanense]
MIMSVSGSGSGNSIGSIFLAWAALSGTLAAAAAGSSSSAFTSTSSAPPPALTVSFLSPEIGGASRFYPFHDLELLASGEDTTLSKARLIQTGLDGDQNVLLFPTGCQVDVDDPGNDAVDCTRACRNASSLFSSLDTFYNCAALASVAYWSRSGNGSSSSGSSSSAGGGGNGDHHRARFYIPAQAERNASVLMGPGGSLAAFDERPVLSAFVTCAQAACGEDGIRTPCNDSIKALTQQSPPGDVFDAINTFCPDIAAEINPDIFGPGVLISYVLQVCFSSLLYLATRFFTMYVSFSERGRLKEEEQRRQLEDDQRQRQEQQQQQQSQKQQQGQSQSLAAAGPTSSSSLRLQRRLTRIERVIWRDSSALSRTSIAIATTLVEFQEAQCWFVFAIQIASILAIVVNSQEGTFWGEIMVNAAVAFHVSQNGVLPMFLVQICLHHEGVRNWHTFLGFVVEYLLAIVATTQKVYFRDAFALFRSESRIDACGGNPSPRSYCAAMHGVDGINLGFFPRPRLYKMVFLVLDTFAMVVLVVDQMSWTLRTHRWTSHLRIGRYRVGRGPAGRYKVAWLRAKRWVWLLLELAYLIINILYMISLIKVFNTDSFEASKWSYGQIIAMTVWGPVIVKLFDLVVSGPPKNGTSLNSGPPRLRIDNVINRRLGTSADEELEATGYVPGLGRKIPGPPPELDLSQARSRTRDTGDMTDDGLSTGVKSV